MMNGDEFIKECSVVHNGFYSYSKTYYINAKSKITITCPIHGDFIQPAGNHLSGRGCKECAIIKKIPKHKNTFIKKALNIHNYKFSYDNIDYINMKTKINLLCPEHGEFSVKPERHLAGTECPKCKSIKHFSYSEVISKLKDIYPNYSFDNFIVSNSITKSKIICNIHGEFISDANKLLSLKGCPSCFLENEKLNFIKKASIIHNNLYSYDKINYINKHTKITITCPVHGDFQQKPNNHLSGHGCLQCGIQSKYITKEEFITISNNIFNFRYDYSKVDYVDASHLITIICPVHGEFQQISGTHMRGLGCTECSSEKRRLKLLKKTLEEAKEIHNNKYLYNIENIKKEFFTLSSRVPIECPEHGTFIQNIGNHSKGANCPQCIFPLNAIERYENKPTTLYYVYFKELDLYKIGLTKQSVEKRFNIEIKRGYSIIILQTTLYENGLDAYKMEQYILERYKDFKYMGNKVLDAGNTELFTYDILGLNKGNK